MKITIEPVTTGSGMRAFIRYPLVQYRGDPLYVPHLLRERKRFFSPSNPLFEFTEARYFLARGADGRPAGRVSAHVNRRHNEATGEKTGFFGFFECVEDVEAARLLLAAAEEDLRSRGMAVIRGPFNFSTNEECGLLVRGFDRAPALMMPYNPPYYSESIMQAGYAAVRSLLAYDFSYDGTMPAYLERAAARIARRSGVRVRPFDMRRFEDEVTDAFQLYNAAWERNWGFVPMTEAEFLYASREMRGIVDPDLAYIAEKDGRPIGFSLTLPDYNEVLIKLRGRLFPFGFLRFALGRGSIRRVRTLLLGVVPEYRNQGIDVLLYHETFLRGGAKGYREGEMSWVLEENAPMRRALERMGATVGKVYRIYEKAL